MRNSGVFFKTHHLGGDFDSQMGPESVPKVHNQKLEEPWPVVGSQGAGARYPHVFVFFEEGAKELPGVLQGHGRRALVTAADCVEAGHRIVLVPIPGRGG